MKVFSISSLFDIIGNEKYSSLKIRLDLNDSYAGCPSRKYNIILKRSLNGERFKIIIYRKGKYIDTCWVDRFEAFKWLREEIINKEHHCIIYTDAKERKGN